MLLKHITMICVLGILAVFHSEAIADSHGFEIDQWKVADISTTQTVAYFEMPEGYGHSRICFFHLNVPADDEASKDIKGNFLIELEGAVLDEVKKHADEKGIDFFSGYWRGAIDIRSSTPLRETIEPGKDTYSLQYDLSGPKEEGKGRRSGQFNRDEEHRRFNITIELDDAPPEGISLWIATVRNALDVSYQSSEKVEGMSNQPSEADRR